MVKNLQNILLYVAFYLSLSAVVCIFVADYKYGLHEEYSSGHRPLFQRREVYHPIWRYASGRVFAEAYISNTYARHRFPAASLSAFLPNPAAGFPSVFHNQLINIIMLKTIKLYETPDMMVFEMHPESGMLNVTSPVYGDPGEAGADGFLTIIGEDY